MNPDCQYYVPPRPAVYTEPDTGIEHGYESSAWCKLSDNPCLVEYGESDDCDEYNDYLKELKEE